MITVNYINNQYDLVCSYFINIKNAKKFIDYYSQFWIEWVILDGTKIIEKSSSKLIYL